MSTLEQTKPQLKPQPAALQFPALAPPLRYLFGPGPSMVHPRVYEALSKPIVGHLDPYFIQVMTDVQQLLKTTYGTNDGATLVISGTGSAGMEAAVANFVDSGTKLAVFACNCRRCRCRFCRTRRALRRARSRNTSGVVFVSRSHSGRSRRRFAIRIISGILLPRSFERSCSGQR